MSENNICIFPGTFNPIHSAHLRVAHFALSNYGFDKIIFIPAYIPPHKELDNNIAKHRFNMVKLAAANNPRFEVSDIEFKSQGKSYTYNTVCSLIDQYKIDGKINMLIGTDAFEKIDTWYNTDGLKNLVHFIVFPRGVELTEKSGYDYEMAPMEYFNVSSTEIRNHFSEGKIVNSVKEYIEKNGLYKA